jgi:hypothetical protein
VGEGSCSHISLETSKGMVPRDLSKYSRRIVGHQGGNNHGPKGHLHCPLGSPHQEGPKDK